ncbi:hypothetical protein Tco_0756584 [Tanacetum coccineum]
MLLLETDWRSLGQDYGFVATMDREIRRDRRDEVLDMGSQKLVGTRIVEDPLGGTRDRPLFAGFRDAKGKILRRSARAREVTPLLGQVTTLQWAPGEALQGLGHRILGTGTMLRDSRDPVRGSCKPEAARGRDGSSCQLD